MKKTDDRLAGKRLIGYARRSTDSDNQLAELRAAGCERIFEEAIPETGMRPVLTRMMSDLAAGDIVVVSSLDRLARSGGHLLELLEDFMSRDVYLRSLRDRFDTSTPQDVIGVVSALVKMQQALTSEQTRAGIAAARSRGRQPGNPGLRQKREDAVKAVSRARQQRYIAKLGSSANTWLPTVRKLRPLHSWDNVVEVLNRRGENWTIERLRRAVRRLVEENLAEPELLDRSPRRTPEDRLMKLVAAIAIAQPGISLRSIAAELDRLQEKPPRGGPKWQASSVRALLDEAYRFGLLRD